MQHLHNLFNLLQLLRRHRQPVVEGLRQLGSNLLPRSLADVVERLQQHLGGGDTENEASIRQCLMVIF